MTDESWRTAIHHVDGMRLLSFISAAAQITERANIRSIYQHPQDPLQLCVDLQIVGRGLFAAIVRYDPDLWIPADIPLFESVTAPSITF